MSPQDLPLDGTATPVLDPAEQSAETAVVDRSVDFATAARSTWRWLRRRPGHQVALAAIVGFQAAWFAVLTARGWFFNDDFTFMGQSVGRSLSWSYLTLPVNVHLAPGLRLAYWLSVHYEHLHYWPSVVWRVALQMIATVLLYRLLVRLTRSVRGSLIVTAGYAFSPLLLPAMVYLAAAINQLPSQLFLLVALHCCLNYDRDRKRKRRWALLCGLSLVAAACFWEKTAIDGALIIVVLRLGWLTSGSLRHRVGSLARDVVGWVAILGPLAVFFGYFLTHDYGASAQHLSLARDLHLAWGQWSRSLFPGVIGGPWHWFALNQVYNSVADPPRAVVVLGQAAFVVLLVVGWLRTRWLGLLAWSLPLLTVFVGEALIGAGRFSLLGVFITLDYHYAADLAVPTAIAIALACFGPRARESAAATAPAMPRVRHSARRLRTPIALVLAAAVLVTAALSDLRWVNRFEMDGAHRYVGNLLAGVSHLPPSSSVYDTTVPLTVLPFIENEHLSDLLALSGRKVAFDGANPELADSTGHLRQAVFYVDAVGPGASHEFCPRPIQGITTSRVRLNAPVGDNEYFLRVDYFQQRPTTLRVTVRGANGKVIPARGPDTIGTDTTLGASLIALTFGSPAEVTFTSDSAATNICLTQVAIGVPLLASP